MNKGNSFSGKPLPKVDEKVYIEIQNNGPYMVHGNIPIREYFVIANNRNIPVNYKVGEVNYIKPNTVTALCRCGQTKHRPYCDGTHLKIGYKNTPLKLSESLLKNAEVIRGERVLLTDNDSYCSFSRFCDTKGGIWSLAANADNQQMVNDAMEMVANCPSGRLQLWDKESHEELDQTYAPEIGLIEDLPLEVPGPIWVKGGIPIRTAEGFEYERRNRVALCRCGRTSMAPFCNGSHSIK